MHSYELIMQNAERMKKVETYCASLQTGRVYSESPSAGRESPGNKATQKIQQDAPLVGHSDLRALETRATFP